MGLSIQFIALLKACIPYNFLKFVSVEMLFILVCKYLESFDNESIREVGESLETILKGATLVYLIVKYLQILDYIMLNFNLY